MKRIEYIKEFPLWNKSKIKASDLYPAQAFHIENKYIDESHHKRFLLKCKKSGLYFLYDSIEEVDYVSGNDARYAYYLPFKDRNEAESAAQTDPIPYDAIRPHLYMSWPSDQEEPSYIWR